MKGKQHLASSYSNPIYLNSSLFDLFGLLLFPPTTLSKKLLLPSGLLFFLLGLGFSFLFVEAGGETGDPFAKKSRPLDELWLLKEFNAEIASKSRSVGSIIDPCSRDTLDGDRPSDEWLVRKDRRTSRTVRGRNSASN